MSRRRDAFSLVELILAIGLSVALVALLGLAINLHLIRLDDSRSTVEQAQLARSILDRVAEDLRAASTAPTQDFSEQLAAADSAAQFDVDEVDDAEPSEEDAAAAAGPVTPPPGVNGLVDTLTVDRRLMRQTLLVPEEGATPVPRADAAWAQVAWGLSTDPGAPGLVRTETTYEHARWRLEQGQAAPLEEPIAPEVLGLRFAYFDGTQYLEAWDMAELGALPVAVEVTVRLAAADADDPSAPARRRQPRTYRRVVRLPAAAEEESALSSGAGMAEASDTGGF